MKKEFATLAAAVVLAGLLAAGCGGRNTEKTAMQSQERTVEAEPDSNGNLVRVGQIVPSFTVNYLDGTVKKVEEFRGKVLLVNFWASWCPDCVNEFKEIPENLIKKYADNEDFAYVFISRGEENEAILKFMEKKGYDTIPEFRSAIATDRDSSVFLNFAKKGIPRNYLVDREGKLVFLGYDYSEENFAALQTAINETLKK